MEQNPAEERYDQFIDRIVATGTVWALKSGEGFATSESDEFEDLEVLPFWSEEGAAATLAKDEWAGFEATAIPLSEFLEQWLPGLHSEDVVAGIDWDAQMMGTEMEPVDLALDIADALADAGKTVAFTNYRDLDDYREQLQNAQDQ